MIDVFIVNGKNKDTVRRQIKDCRTKVEENMPADNDKEVSFKSPNGKMNTSTSGVTLKSFTDGADFTENGDQVKPWRNWPTLLAKHYCLCHKPWTIKARCH